MRGEEDGVTKFPKVGDQRTDAKGNPEIYVEAPVPEMKVFTSGAKSTVKKPRYDLVPLITDQLIAERHEYGASRHGVRNYLKGKDDQEFITDRINHLIEHAKEFATHRRRSDLAAILCNGSILADCGAFVDDTEGR